MENKKEQFLKKYFAEPRSDKQLAMLKEFMLSLSPDELKAFVMEPLQFLLEALKSEEVSEVNKAKIKEKLEELTFLMTGKVTV
jgi:hypothetical protein